MTFFKVSRLFEYADDLPGLNFEGIMNRGIFLYICLRARLKRSHGKGNISLQPMR